MDWENTRYWITTSIAVLALVLPPFREWRRGRYAGSWGRKGQMRGEVHQAINNTGEDAEEVAIYAVPYSSAGRWDGEGIAHIDHVAPGAAASYTFPMDGAIFIRIEWKRSSTRVRYVRDLVDVDRRSFRQRVGHRISGTAYPSNKTRRMR